MQTNTTIKEYTLHPAVRLDILSKLIRSICKLCVTPIVVHLFNKVGNWFNARAPHKIYETYNNKKQLVVVTTLE